MDILLILIIIIIIAIVLWLCNCESNNFIGNYESSKVFTNLKDNIYGGKETRYIARKKKTNLSLEEIIKKEYSSDDILTIPYSQEQYDLGKEFIKYFKCRNESNDCKTALLDIGVFLTNMDKKFIKTYDEILDKFDRNTNNIHKKHINEYKKYHKIFKNMYRGFKNGIDVIYSEVESYYNFDFILTGDKSKINHMNDDEIIMLLRYVKALSMINKKLLDCIKKMDIITSS